MTKKIVTLLVTLLISLTLTSCTGNKFNDGKDRPSNAGKLQVIDNLLCSAKGEPVMLRGLSSNGVSISQRYINQETFDELSTVFGINVFRMSLYTYGTGDVGYCTGGNQDELKDYIYQSVEYAKNSDMYLIVDWHVLMDEDPMKYLEEAKVFFEEVSQKLVSYNNVIYEICNEPNNVTWQVVKEYAEIIIPIIRNNDPESLILVGSPDWSKDLASVANNPLAYDNILYTYHFYSHTHKQEYRDSFKYYLSCGLPIFVSEFGICSASGGYPRNIEEADKWIELLEENNISYVMWNFSRTSEACASIKNNCLKTSDFDLENELTETGIWLINTIKKYAE